MSNYKNDFNLVIKGSLKQKIALFFILIIFFLGLSNYISDVYIMFFNIGVIFCSLSILYVLKGPKILNKRLGFIKPLRLLIILNILYLLFLCWLMTANFSHVIAVFMLHNTKKIIDITITSLEAGIFEELLCRGLLFSIFITAFKNSNHKLLFASLLNGIIFGFLHFGNAIFANQNIEVTFQQVFYASCIGVIFSFIRVSTNGLLIGILVHSLLDFDPSILSNISSLMDWTTLLIIFIPGVILAILYFYQADKLVTKGITIN